MNWMKRVFLFMAVNLLALISTHPPIKDRIEALRRGHPVR